MSQNDLSNGRTLRFTAAAAHSSGDFIVIGGVAGTVQYDVADGEDGIIATEGVKRAPALNTEAWDLGDPLYWDGTALTVDSAAGANPQVAVAYKAKELSATTGAAKINVVASA